MFPVAKLLSSNFTPEWLVFSPFSFHTKTNRSLHHTHTNTAIQRECVYWSCWECVLAFFFRFPPNPQVSVLIESFLQGHGQGGAGAEGACLTVGSAAAQSDTDGEAWKRSMGGMQGVSLTRAFDDAYRRRPLFLSFIRSVKTSSYSLEEYAFAQTFWRLSPFPLLFISLRICFLCCCSRISFRY